MSASVLPGVGIGTGQPTRSDFEGEAHEARLRPGHNLGIPPQTVTQTRDRPKTHEELRRRGTGWQRQDAAVGASHDQQDRAEGWGKFAGGRNDRGWRPGQGTVQIDQRGGFQVKDLGVSRNPENWVNNAARLEELFRKEGERYGIDAELKLPGEGPPNGPGSELGTGRNNKRRPFTLKG